MSLYKKYEDAAITALGVGNYDEAIQFLTSIPDSERSGEADVFLAAAKMQAEDYSGEDEFYKLAELAASKGEYKVYEILGQMFVNGHFSGVKESDKANECFKIGAEHGNVVCMNYYAMLLDDSGKPRESVDWFTKAAELGHPTSQFNLALHYENGRGVKKDIDKAIYWYEKAAENGDEDAPEAIESLKKKKAVIESGVLTQEEIDGGFEITGEDDRKLSLPEKQNAIKKYKTITKSPVDIMGYYYVDEQFFKDVEAAEAGDEALIARYIGSSLKHLGDEQYANQNELLMYWLGKALEYKASDALAIAFLKLKDSDCLAKEMYDAAVIIKGNPSTIVPFASMMVDSWLKTHKPPRKTSKKSNTNQITKKQDRIEIFDQDTISLFSQHLALEGTSPCSVRYEDITMLEFTSNGFCMVLRIYSEGVDGKVFICADNKDSDRLHDVLKDLEERLPDKDSVEIIDNNNTTPDESTQIIASAFADALKETLGQNFQSSQEYDAVFEWLDLDSNEDITGYLEGKVDLNKEDERNGAYFFKIKLTFDHNINDDDLLSFDMDVTHAELSNTLEETIDMGGFQIPSSYVSETHTEAIWIGSLYEEENEYRVMVSAKIERSYTEFEWSANLTCENIERVGSDSIIISFKAECTDPVAKNWDDDDDVEIDNESESLWETDDDFEIEDENSESSSDNSVQNYTAYQEGSQLYISRHYADALKAFERVESDYLDVVDMRVKCRMKLMEEEKNPVAYKKAKEYYDAGKYSEALSEFSKITGYYLDASSLKNECRQRLLEQSNPKTEEPQVAYSQPASNSKKTKLKINTPSPKTIGIAIAVGVLIAILTLVIILVVHSNSNESLYAWEELPDGTIQINGIDEDKIDKLIEDGVLTLPSEIDGKKVSVISASGVQGVDELKEIIIPEGVTTISDRAFHQCDNLEKIIIPNSVTSIGEFAFNGCLSLTNITISNGVTSIGSHAFKGCSALSIVSFGKNVEEIGESAFADCNNLTSITMPNKVSVIAHSTFKGCDSLISINLSNVVEIKPYAFSGCSDLKSIYIPTSVTSIDSTAFENCNALEGVYITDLVAWCGIDFSGFSFEGHPLMYAKKLYLNNELVTNLVIPDGVKQIKSKAFFNCETIKSVIVPSSIVSIGAAAFSGCTSLESISIPFVGASADATGYESHFGYIFGYSSNKSSYSDYHLEDVQYYSYYIPEGLKNVIVTNATSIQASAFQKCNTLSSVIINKGVTSIGDCAFLGCVVMTDVNIPDGVQIIGSSAFSECSSLKEIKIPASVTNISSYAFRGCANMINAKISNGVQTIGISAFYGCSSLKDVEIPISVTSIEESAFYGCTSMINMTIPDSVTSIGDSVFEGCISLESITLPFVGSTKDGTDNTHFGYIFGASSYSNNRSYIPSNLKTVVITGGTKIAWSAFAGCASLENITLPFVGSTKDGTSNTHFGYIFGASSSSDNSSKVPSSLKTVVITNCTKIENSAFYGCTNLVSIKIPEGITSIGNSAFSGCTSLDYNEYDNAYYLGNDSNPYVVLVKAKDTSITSCQIHNEAKIVYNSAFSGCAKIKSIKIPEGITSIGNSAFSGCTSLNYNEYDNAYYLGNYKNPYIVLVKAKDTSITSCQMNINTRFICDFAFSGCTKIESIKIPEGITSIGNSAFSGCTSLTNIKIPDGITVIADSLFSRCISLTNVIIPDSVTSIGNYAFYLCGITSVTISESVTNIGAHAFSGCAFLSSVIFKSTNGWYYIGYSSYKFSLPSTSLSSPYNAANLLTDTYDDYVWKRN